MKRHSWVFNELSDFRDLPCFGKGRIMSMNIMGTGSTSSWLDTPAYVVVLSALVAVQSMINFVRFPEDSDNRLWDGSIDPVGFQCGSAFHCICVYLPLYASESVIWLAPRCSHPTKASLEVETDPLDVYWRFGGPVPSKPGLC